MSSQQQQQRKESDNISEWERIYLRNNDSDSKIYLQQTNKITKQKSQNKKHSINNKYKQKYKTRSPKKKYKTKLTAVKPTVISGDRH